mgnify:CR=1 FL=1
MEGFEISGHLKGQDLSCRSFIGMHPCICSICESLIRRVILLRSSFIFQQKNQELIELLELEKSLVYFSTSLRSNELVLEKMLKIDKIKQYPEDEELLDDVIIENKQAIEMADIYSNILSGTMMHTHPLSQTT